MLRYKSMKDFKKRALILTLAATVSVTGSFAADNYKNCLMNMEFSSSGDKEVNLILNTKTPYEGSISPIRKDSSTYIIMLPEVDSKAPTPDLSEAGQFIKSVEIRRMPYANGSKGYTKILIKTADMINLNTSAALYIPSEDIPQIPEIVSSSEDNARERLENKVEKQPVHNNRYNNGYSNGRIYTSQSETQYERSAHSEPPITQEPVQTDNTDSSIENQPQPETEVPVTTDETSHQKFLIGLLALFIVMASVYCYLLAQDNVTNVTGEKLKIDVDDDPEEAKKEAKKKRRLSNTINRLNSTYSQPAPLQMKSYIEQENTTPEEQEEEMNVVDLDALFKEKQSEPPKQSEQAEGLSNALDDFLSGFKFDDEELIEKLENAAKNGTGFDEEEYERLIKNKDIVFTKDDIACFNELLRSDISDNAIQNMDKYAVSNPIEPQKRNPDKVLEKLVTDYAISQNITFNSEDINILKKLISVEIDESFINDLRTNPNLTERMTESIKSASVRHKPSEIITLNVKDLLPNLSHELKKQGNRPIVSEVKPETVYYSEGYEVSTLSLDFDMPDLAKELKNKHAFDSKPSHHAETVDNSYANTVDKLQISGLPDLKDVVEHPDKYIDEEPEQHVVDENALLNSILNVQFKPFDDGSRKFEIINDFDDEEEEEPIQTTFDDVQKEFNQFSNFEVATSEESDRNYTEPNYDDFEALYNQEFVDLDANKTSDNTENIPQTPSKKIHKNISKSFKNSSNTKQETKHKAKFIPKNLNRVSNKLPKRPKREKSEKLLQMLDKIRDERKVSKNSLRQTSPAKREPRTNTRATNVQPPTIVKCILEGINYDVVTSSAIDTSIGCHLAKSDKGYKVLAYHGTELSVIKEYDSLNNERLQIRQSETLSDGTPRYLVKVAQYKFLVDIKDNRIQYVMDLC